MPLSFSAEEMDLLLSLAAPIAAAQRSAFPGRGCRRDRGAGKRDGPRPPDGAAHSAGFLDAAAAFAERDGARASRPRRLRA